MHGSYTHILHVQLYIGIFICLFFLVSILTGDDSCLNVSLYVCVCLVVLKNYHWSVNSLSSCWICHILNAITNTHIHTKADWFWMGCCVSHISVCGRWVCACVCERRRHGTNVDLCFLFACHYRCCRCCCCCCFQSFYLIFKFNVSLAINECQGYDHIDTHMIVIHTLSDMS